MQISVSELMQLIELLRAKPDKVPVTHPAHIEKFHRPHFGIRPKSTDNVTSSVEKKSATNPESVLAEALQANREANGTSGRVGPVTVVRADVSGRGEIPVEIIGAIGPMIKVRDTSKIGSIYVLKPDAFNTADRELAVKTAATFDGSKEELRWADGTPADDLQSE